MYTIYRTTHTHRTHHVMCECAYRRGVSGVYMFIYCYSVCEPRHQWEHSTIACIKLTDQDALEICNIQVLSYNILCVVVLSLSPRPKTNPRADRFQYRTWFILEAIYTPDEVWGRD